MTKTEIILDWLKIKENRDKLPSKKLNKSEYEAIASYGHIWKFDDEEIGCSGKQYFKISKIN